MSKIKDSITDEEWNQREIAESRGAYCVPDFEGALDSIFADNIGCTCYGCITGNEICVFKKRRLK